MVDKTAVVLTVNKTKEADITVERLDDDIDYPRRNYPLSISHKICTFVT